MKFYVYPMRFFIRTISFISLLFCLCNCDSSIDDNDSLFNGIDKMLSSDQKKKLIECKEIHCFDAQSWQIYNDGVVWPIPELHQLKAKLDSNGIDADHSLIILIAFGRHLRHEPYSWKGIQKEVLDYFRKIENIHRLKDFEYISRLKKVAEENYDRFSPNDTIWLSFPLGKTDDGALYHRAFSSEFFPDSLTTLCVLLEKLPIDSIENLNSVYTPYIFQLKVLSLNKDPYELMGKKISAGDSLELDIFGYGRLIRGVSD